MNSLKSEMSRSIMLQSGEVKALAEEEEEEEEEEEGRVRN